MTAVDTSRSIDPISFKIFRLLFLSSILCAPVLFGAVRLWSFSVSMVLMAAAMLVYGSGAFHSSRGGLGIVRTADLEPWAVLYLVTYAVSGMFSSLPAITAVETYKLAGLALTYCGTMVFCRNQVRIRALCVVIVFFGGTLSVVGLLQYAGGVPKPWWNVPGFLSSVYVNHNHFAGLLELLLPVSLGFTAAERDPAKKTLFGFLCVLMGTAFVFTLSRGGYVAIAAGAITMCVLMRKRFLVGVRLLIIFVCLLAAAAFLFGLGPVAVRIQTMIQVAQGETSASDRWFMWRGAWDLIRNHPWWGTGPGTFEFAFLKYRPTGFVGRPVFAHNEYLNLMADCGVPAFLIAMMLLVALIMFGLRTIRRNESRSRAGVGAGCVGALVAFSVHGLIDFNFHIPANGIWFSIIVGLLVSLDREWRPNVSLGGFWSRIASGAFLAIFMIGVGVFGLSDFFLEKSRALSGTPSEAVVADLDASLRINPGNGRVYYLRALAKEARKDPTAAADFGSAVRLNPLEPYYDLRRVRNLLSRGTVPPDRAMAYYDGVIAKDPFDPKLCYLVADDILKIYPTYDTTLAKWAWNLLERASRLGPAYFDVSLETLWKYEGRPDTLEAFKAKVFGSEQAILWFFKRTDRWKNYRAVFLKSEGVDLQRKYHVLGSVLWRDPAAQTFLLVDFTETLARRIFKGSCFYGPGSLAREVRLDNALSRLVITARGNRVGRSYPLLVVRLDGRVIDGHYVDTRSDSHYDSVLETVPGVHRLELEYVNDFAGGIPRIDRNVWIEQVEIQYPQG